MNEGTSSSVDAVKISGKSCEIKQARRIAIDEQMRKLRAFAERKRRGKRGGKMER